MKQETMWDAVNELGCLLGDIEKMQFIANTVHETASDFYPCRGSYSESAGVTAILNMNDIRVGASILLDQLVDFQARMSKAVTTMETMCLKQKENNTQNTVEQG